MEKLEFIPAILSIAAVALFQVIVMALTLPVVLVCMLLSHFDVALPIIAGILLVLNFFVLVVLLLIRHFWKRRGTMERSYINTLSGWKHIVMLILRYALIAFIVWEVLLVLICIALMIWGPDLLYLLIPAWFPGR